MSVYRATFRAALKNQIFFACEAGPFLSLTGNTNPMSVRPGFALIKGVGAIASPARISAATPAVQSKICNGLRRAL
jgi:hypothetical protein